nr:2911_t:CDS:2 [Entrophospora candida]
MQIEMFTTKDKRDDDEDIDSEFHNADIINNSSNLFENRHLDYCVSVPGESTWSLHKGNIDTSLEEILESTVNPNLNNSDDEKMGSDDRMDKHTGEETSETLGFPVATVERTIQVYGKSEASISKQTQSTW